MSEPQEDNDPVVLLKKIQQHLVYLEKKIDALVAQQGAPSQGGGGGFKRNFSRPPRPFDHPHGSGRGKRPHRGNFGGGGGRGERSDSFQRPFDGGGRGDEPRRDDRPRGGGEGQGFFRKKKPFFRRDRG